MAKDFSATAFSPTQEAFLSAYLTEGPYFAIKTLPTTLSSWEIDTPTSRALSNYLDALFFASRGSALLANRHLQKLLEKELSLYLIWEEYAERLSQEEHYLLTNTPFCPESALHHKNIALYLTQTPHHHAPLTYHGFPALPYPFLSPPTNHQRLFVEAADLLQALHFSSSLQAHLLHHDPLPEPPWSTYLYPSLNHQTPNLYQHAFTHKMERTYHRLGPHRALPLYTSLSLECLFNQHLYSSAPAASFDLLQEITHQAKPQPPHTSTSSPHPILHILPTFLDQGYAPGTKARDLLQGYDRTLYAPHVYVTEYYAVRPSEYPHTLNHPVPDTLSNCSQTAALLASLDIPFTIADTTFSLQETVQEVHRYIEQHQIETIVFHGTDPLHTLISLETSAPIRICYEHGTLPRTASYDAIILSQPDDLTLSQDLFTSLQIMPYCNDSLPRVDTQSSQAPLPKTHFGCPSNALLMCTISNHIEERLSHEMCSAVQHLLLHNPKVHYVIIGHLHNPQYFLERFSPEIRSRIQLFGESSYPAYLARSMDLYLNEFPQGGGMAIIDAMAASLPVVTMYNPSGPMQGRHAGHYIGRDKAVQASDTAAYIALAESLLNDPIKRAQWGAENRHRYEQRTQKSYAECYREILDAIQASEISQIDSIE